MFIINESLQITRNKHLKQLIIMKTITLFFFILLACTLTTNAQITKGNWMVGGSGEYINQTFKNDDESKTKLETIAIRPNVGYFIIDKFALGGAFRFQKQSIYHTYGVGLFSRYYFLKTEKMFNLFAQIHYDYTYVVSDGHVNGHYYGARIGQVIFFNSSVGLEFAVEYERGETSNNISSDSVKAIIGFQIYLDKK